MTKMRGSQELLKKYEPLIKKINGSKRKKRLVSVVRKFRPDREQMQAVITELTNDPLMDPFAAITKARKGIALEEAITVLHHKDSREIRALKNAAEAANTTEEEILREAMREYLTTRSFLSRAVVEQLETLQFVEEELGTITA